jgi:hypothetical protein
MSNANKTTSIIIMVHNGNPIDAEIKRPFTDKKVFEKFTKTLKERGIFSEKDEIIDENDFREGGSYKYLSLKEKNISFIKIDKDDSERSVSDITEEINYLRGICSFLSNETKENNRSILVTEILNLWNGVGDGYVEGDYYASNRYYSKIPGVKNIRNCNKNQILVKVISPAGYLLPNSVTINGEEITLVFEESTKYDNTMDY